MNIKSFLLSIVMLLTALAVWGQTTTVQMERDGGVFTVPCKVNGLSMKFIFDTGASTVCISATEALFMLKNGYLDPSDIKGRNYSQVANGDIVEGMTVNLREVEIGGLPLKNVEASVVQSLSAPLLFGQTAIQKLGPIKLDGDKLIIGKVSALNEEQRKKKSSDLNTQAYLANQSGRPEEAIKLYNQANEVYPLAINYDGLCYVYSELGRKEDAIKASERALSLEPSNIQYKYNYAVALYKGEKYEAAQEIFLNFYDEAYYMSRKTGIQKEGIQAMISACNFLGDIYQKRGMLGKAVSWFNKGIKESQPQMFGTNIFAYQHLGDIAFDSAQYRKAIELYKIGISETPNDVSNIPYYYKIGKSYAHLGNDSSFVFFQAATKIYQHDSENLVGMDYVFPSGLHLYDYSMESFLELGRWKFQRFKDSNYEEKNIGVLVDSCYSKVYNEGYGIRNGKKGAFQEDDFAKWLSSSIYVGDSSAIRKSLQYLGAYYPKNINFLYIMTVMTSDDSKETMAKHETMYKAILNHFDKFYLENRSEILNNLAWAQCCSGNYRSAEVNASQAIDLDSNDPNKWATYGEALFYQGKYKQCIEAMTKSIDLTVNQDDAGKWLKGAYNLRGQSYLKTGKQTKGEKDIERSDQL